MGIREFFLNTIPKPVVRSWYGVCIIAWVILTTVSGRYGISH